ncbi:MAG TPA: pyridoxal-phosphate dependent enzyme, partial [Spirochaetia bacterium]|nr:pyridoxal-phosphate dependent enzyme [Spirochaetia bacterium]
MAFFYRCSECGKNYDISPQVMLCPDCSGEQEADTPLRGILEVGFEAPVKGDIGTGQEQDIFGLLPVEREYFPPIPVGNTPLWEPSRLRQRLGLPNLFIKDDTLNPTGSLKDRASYLVAAFARKFKENRVVLASTGNAASSMAGVGAAAGLSVTLFVPRTAPRAKLVQAHLYGAEVIPVDGSYDKAYELSLQYTRAHGGLNRNTAFNPLTIEGKKTVALEIHNQLDRLDRVPDFIFVPVGDGVILSGVFKGFRDLLSLGRIRRMPVLCGVNAEGSSALFRAFQSGSFLPPSESHTLADSIAVDVPRCGTYALKL